MSVNYSIAMLANPQDRDAAPKAYARAQISGEMSLKTLAKEVSGKCTVHYADVSAVLIATVETLLAALREGKQVDFGELGKFRLQITSKGSPTAEEFTAAHIKGVNIQFVPGEDLQTVFEGLKFNLVPGRTAQAALLRSQKKGETNSEGAAVPPEGDEG